MQGSCLCGAIKYHTLADTRSVVACHCSQCRKTSGHYVAATQTLAKNLEIQGQEAITWYHSSTSAKRGFCKFCGSQLFWQQNNAEMISIMAGTIDGESGLLLDRQLFSDDKGDYYALPEVETVDQSTL